MQDMQDMINEFVGKANETMLAEEIKIARTSLLDMNMTLAQLRGSLDGAQEELDRLSLQVNDLSVDSESEHVQDLATRLAKRSLKTLSTLTTFVAKKETLKDSMREVVESRAGSIGAFLHEARLMVEGDPTSDFQTTELNLAEARLEKFKALPETSIDEVDNKLKTLTHTLSGINGVMGEKQGDIAAAAAEAAVVQRAITAADGVDEAYKGLSKKKQGKSLDVAKAVTEYNRFKVNYGDKSGNMKVKTAKLVESINSLNVAVKNLVDGEKGSKKPLKGSQKRLKAFQEPSGALQTAVKALDKHGFSATVGAPAAAAGGGGAEERRKPAKGNMKQPEGAAKAGQENVSAPGNRRR